MFVITGWLAGWLVWCLRIYLSVSVFNVLNSIFDAFEIVDLEGSLHTRNIYMYIYIPRTYICIYLCTYLMYVYVEKKITFINLQARPLNNRNEYNFLLLT